MIYMLCFLGLMFIDWSRGSQVGSTWAWTVNLTGIVMAVILFTLVPLKDFVKPVYLIYSLICLAAMPAAYYWWWDHQALIYRDKLLTAVLNVWVLGLLAIHFLIRVKQGEQKVRLSLLQVLAILCLIWMTISANEDIWPVWYLVMFFLFWQSSWDEKIRDQMLWGMLDGILAGFFAIQGLAFVFRPFDYIRYSGMYNNTNMNGLFYSISMAAFLGRLYLYRSQKGPRWKIVFNWLFAAAMCAFVLYTMCRTAMVAVIGLVVVFVIMADLIHLKDKAIHVAGRLLLFGLTIMLAMVLEYFPMRYLPAYFSHPIWYDGEWDEMRVQPNDSWDSWKYESFLYVLDELFLKFGIDTDLYDRYHELLPLLTLRVYAEEYPLYGMDGTETGITVTDDGILHTGNRSLDGRQLIYKIYLSDANLMGHPLRDSQFRIGSNFYVWHAQNILVQVIFMYGIPAGILFFLIGLCIFRRSLKNLKGDMHGTAMVVLLFMTTRFLYGITEVTWYPGQIVLFLLFFLPKFLQSLDFDEKS
ncbi:MAG: hypothetical protein K5682_08375 [Lachnospiraceae bacterium]|nr:hypothetical protein [Lachnospiraceae bacterium]